MRSLQSALVAGLLGLGLSGCVDEGVYSGPQRYEVGPRDYRRYDDYGRYDPPPRYSRYDRYDPPIYDRYEPRPSYGPYDRPPPRRYDRYDRSSSVYDRPRPYRPPVRDDFAHDRPRPIEPANPQPVESRPPPGLPPPPRGDRPPSEPPRATSTVLNHRSGLTQDCVGQGTDQKCRLRLDRAAPQR